MNRWIGIVTVSSAVTQPHLLEDRMEVNALATHKQRTPRVTTPLQIISCYYMAVTPYQRKVSQGLCMYCLEKF